MHIRDGLGVVRPSQTDLYGVNAHEQRIIGQGRFLQAPCAASTAI
jgi:hypothetical protein